jgi:endonuclease/exonuclease/phosphatase family metal-dependent hydrolase
MSTKKPSTKLSVLSYNLYCLPWIAVLMKPSTCPYSYARTSAFLQHIPKYDILGLQEVWSPRYQQVESFAKQKGYHVVGSAQAPLQSIAGLRIFGGGLMIMSKYPIETTREAIFDKGVASDGFVRKGILYAKVKVSSSSYVHVFNTHMQASYGYEFAENDPYALIRKKQIQKIVAFIAKIALDDDHPIIMMGDFNVNAIRQPDDPTDSKEYLEMVQALGGKGLFDVIDIHKGLFKGVHPVTNSGHGVEGKKAGKGGQRLDFIFEMRRNSLRKERIFHSFPFGAILPFEVKGEPYTHISDHCASHVILELLNRQEDEEQDGAGAERDDVRMTMRMSIQLTA